MSCFGLDHLAPGATHVRGCRSGSLFLGCVLGGLAAAEGGSRFQMDRLVLLNDKFSPCWRARYVVFESRAALPRAVFQVLGAEGYLSRRPASRRRSTARWLAAGSATVEDGFRG